MRRKNAEVLERVASVAKTGYFIDIMGLLYENIERSPIAVLVQA
jgi:hypothetical protein